ncbi:polysaccharide deacetylase family protein [Photobacterium sp. 1_MG-2023]|uniref:polysaccharide deacetylase family protein n=1 Tax=Photobacterium sp. 1_MG-2023 TaxID=3062646 RepID=UPI0026E13A16|nr:polysaccharide deacetylase family protein [Photobacterium sp. 1_MG-2023]MDO6705829.1 polysaccharide deacetylase family protein [Photobacterium sp. 1_MG-2023]
MKIIRLVLLVCLWPGLLNAAGPDKVATMDRALWPEIIDSQMAFDRASAAEILQFANVIHQTSLANAADINALTGVKQVSLSSVERWLRATQQQLVAGYQSATHLPVHDWQGLVRQAQAQLPVYDPHWRQASEAFYRYYLFEQIRLAALFPRISSEILTMNANEIRGDHFADGEFLLTFDDGPHPTRTPRLIQALNQKEIQAMFFILGHKINATQHTTLYQQQCLGAHGWRHRAHQDLKWSESSIAQTEQAMAPLLSLNTTKTFRPPYGMRSPEFSDWLAQHQIQTYLWNIDSQDWNRTLNAKAVTDRVVTLMLLWRKGVILFHDIHPQAAIALPILDDLITQSNKHWRRCI